MCKPGEILSGCENGNPGACTPCPGGRHKPRQGEWIIPNDAKYEIFLPQDTCKFFCPKGTIFDSTDKQCIRCDPGAPPGDSLACDDEKVYTLPQVDDD